jgi:hypothetical protein
MKTAENIKVIQRKTPKFTGLNQAWYEVANHPEIFTNGQFVIINMPLELAEKWRKSMKGKYIGQPIAYESVKNLMEVFRQDYNPLNTEPEIAKGKYCTIAIFDIGLIDGINARLALNAEAYFFFKKSGYDFMWLKKDPKKNLILLKNGKISGAIMPVSLN